MNESSPAPGERRRPSYDLHLHSHWSYDAFVPVAAYFERARALGMRAIAISEHHVIDSLDEVRAVAPGYAPLRAIPAAEISVDTSIGAVDLLCYGFTRPFRPEMERVLDRYHEWQREYGAALCRGLRKLGFDYSDAQWRDLLHSYRPAHVIALQGYTRVRNGVQIAYFTRRGFARNDGEYQALIRRVETEVGLPPYPPATEVVPVIRQEALVVLAHPTRYFEGANRVRMDMLRDEFHLDGIECAHPGIPAELTPVYRAYCVEKGLVSVGGSDCHTPEQLDTLFARHAGEETWLDELLARLAERGLAGAA